MDSGSHQWAVVGSAISVEKGRFAGHFGVLCNRMRNGDNALLSGCWEYVRHRAGIPGLPSGSLREAERVAPSVLPGYQTVTVWLPWPSDERGPVPQNHGE